jgi:hypothetical protein
MPIVKVQVPLATNDPNTPALIYDEFKTQMTQQTLDDITVRLMKNDAKAFFEAKWNGNRWQLGKRVGWQDW